MLGWALGVSKGFLTLGIPNHGSCFLAFCNGVGGQDELVFDGHSLVIDPSGAVLARGTQFTEDLIVVDIDLDEATTRRQADKHWPAAETRSNHVVLTQGPPLSSSPTASFLRLMNSVKVIISSFLLRTQRCSSSRGLRVRPCTSCSVWISSAVFMPWTYTAPWSSCKESSNSSSLGAFRG